MKNGGSCGFLFKVPPPLLRCLLQAVHQARRGWAPVVLVVPSQGHFATCFSLGSAFLPTADSHEGRAGGFFLVLQTRPPPKHPPRLLWRGSGGRKLRRRGGLALKCASCVSVLRQVCAQENNN